MAGGTAERQAGAEVLGEIGKNSVKVRCVNQGVRDII